MLIKRLFFVLFLIFGLSFNAYALQKSDISASSAVVINKDTKEIVFEKNAYEKRSMASTTKIMTSILAIESGRLSETDPPARLARSHHTPLFPYF